MNRLKNYGGKGARSRQQPHTGNSLISGAHHGESPIVTTSKFLYISSPSRPQGPTGQTPATTLIIYVFPVYRGLKTLCHLTLLNRVLTNKHKEETL